MRDLHRLLAKQDFKTEEDVQAFMDNIMGQEIPVLPDEELSPAEIAQDLVFDAYDLPPAKAKKNIEMTLQMDPDCIEAHEYLGLREKAAPISLIFFKAGIEIGRRLFGGKYLEENKGYFWGIQETRAYMRCLANYSEILYALGKTEASVKVMEEMLELNPNDNQGMRDLLMLYLIQLGETKKFRKYAAQYKDDSTAFPLFNRALFEFQTKGETDKTNNYLKAALKYNPFVAPKILSGKLMDKIPDTYGIGDENEARYYAVVAQPVWQNTAGAVEWLRKHTWTIKSSRR